MKSEKGGGRLKKPARVDVNGRGDRYVEENRKGLVEVRLRCRYDGDVGSMPIGSGMENDWIVVLGFAGWQRERIHGPLLPVTGEWANA